MKNGMEVGILTDLSGENIPLHGRIVAIADVFDALTSKRTLQGYVFLTRKPCRS